MDFPTFAEVRARVGGLKGVIRLLGDAPPEHKWKDFPQCPFCIGSKGAAAVFSKGGEDWFKCHKPGCSSGNRCVTEVGYITMKCGLSEDSPVEGGPSPAYKRLLELANAYVESTVAPPPPCPAAPAVLEAGAPLPETPLPNPVLPPDVPAPAPVPAEPTVALDDVGLIRQAIEMIRPTGKASIAQLKEVLRVGHARALRIMDGLERWGVVGPAVAGEKFRAVLNLPAAGDPPPAQSVGVVSEPGSGDPVAAAVPPTGWADAGAAIINGGPVPPELPQTEPPPVPPVAAPEGKASATVKPEEKPVLAPGVAALRWFYDRTFPTTSQMQAYLPDGSPVPEPLPGAVLKKLRFRPVSLDEKRCLPSAACEALGFRANPRANEALLIEMRGLFDWEELRMSGLHMDATGGKERRPNAQFCGLGQVGKRPEDERPDQDDKWQWGFCEPVLIPYFNEAGELVKLRPHKGGASGGTAAGSERIYIPRDYRTAADRVEKFTTVIICEGEFKAAVLWWVMGGGAVLSDPGSHYASHPVGVCALPGISFARNPVYRADLEDWLRAVGCELVVVAFDDEDKSHKPMRQANDAAIWSRYLAMSLSEEAKISAKVLKLPGTWRVNGKADWDGAAVKFREAMREENS